jgi:hypothetical protein
MSKTLLETVLRLSAASVATIALAAPIATGFGGEDVINGRPWHHLDMTVRALAGDADAGVGVSEPQMDGVGFSQEAAMSIAWHADYIDSYLYNPLWWAEDLPDKTRFKSAIAMQSELVKMHHDDTFTTDGVIDNWERYTAGLLIGLYWAAEQEEGGVAAAHNLLGIASHAAQDFYSHSNWMDEPGRRQRTWFEYSLNEKRAMTLYTAAYETPASQSPHHHGAYSPSCPVLLESAIHRPLSVICGGISPMQDTPICSGYRACDGAETIDMSIYDIDVPSSTLYLQPAGIALDTTILSRIGANQRGLANRRGGMEAGNRSSTERATCNAIVNFGNSCAHDPDGDECETPDIVRQCTVDTDYFFSDTKRLAMRTTEQYMQLLESAVKDFDPSQSGDKYEVFWERVKSNPSNLASRTQQFEDLSRVPFQFMSAGDYPVKNAGTRAHPGVDQSAGWFLRLEIETSNSIGSGTDADIKLDVEGEGFQETFLLDHSPLSTATGAVSSPFLVYNDFEMGDRDVYTVGPFATLPDRVSLVNDSANGDDVVDALLTDFSHTIDSALTSARRLALSIFGGNADYVKDAKMVISTREAERLIGAAAGGRATEKIRIDGGPEGKFDVSYTMQFVDDELTSRQRNDGWRAIEVRLKQLKCIKESEIDGLSASDEPYFFASLSPLSGVSGARVKTFKSQVFTDVDDGETRQIRNNRFILKVPRNGGVVLSVQMWEEDSESAGDQAEAFRTFSTGIDEATRSGNSEFLTTLGQAVGEDWRVERVTITPFKRDKRPVIASSPQVVSDIGWIDGGQRKTIPIDGRRLKPLIARHRDDLSAWKVQKLVKIPENIGRSAQNEDRLYQSVPEGSIQDGAPASVKKPNFEAPVAAKPRGFQSADNAAVHNWSITDVKPLRDGDKITFLVTVELATAVSKGDFSRNVILNLVSTKGKRTQQNVSITVPAGDGKSTSTHKLSILAAGSKPSDYSIYLSDSIKASSVRDRVASDNKVSRRF